MTTVFFNPSLGGDGSTYTEASFANGGHRSNFLPALNNVLGVASLVLTNANTASSSATIAVDAKNAAVLALDQFTDQYLGPKSTPPTLDNDNNPLLTGAIYFDTAKNALQVYTGSIWIDAAGAQASFKRFDFTATANQTIFSVTPDQYTPNFIQVYLDGVLLDSSDYTAINGTTVTLSQGANAGQVLSILRLDSLDIANIIRSISVSDIAPTDSLVINDTGNATFNFDLNVNGNGNVVNTDRTQTITGAKTFNNVSNSFTGSGSGLTSLNANNLSNGTVPSARLGNAVNTAALQDSAVVTSKIAPSAVTTSTIQNNAITDTKINDSAVTTDKINDSAVTTNKINNNAVTAAKLASGAIGIRSTVFTSSGVFTIPAGVTAMKVTVIGGGGGGSPYATGTVGCQPNVHIAGSAGGAGGISTQYLDNLTPSSTLTIVVGAGGNGGAGPSGNGGSGGTSSVSSGTQTITTVSATGGGGGVYSSKTCTRGSGSGGLFNSTGETLTGSLLGLGCSFHLGSIYGGMFGGRGGAGAAATGFGNGGGINTTTQNANGYAGSAGIVIFEY